MQKYSRRIWRQYFRWEQAGWRYNFYGCSASENTDRADGQCPSLRMILGLFERDCRVSRLHSFLAMTVVGGNSYAFSVVKGIIICHSGGRHKRPKNLGMRGKMC